MSEDLARLDATAQAELVRSGEAKPSELIEAAIDRIEQINPELNAVIHRLYDKARAGAQSPEPGDRPFEGVPFLVKDAVCHTQGDPYHLGMRFLKEREYIAQSDTELARRFRAAGFAFVGKSNTPELAISATTEPLAYGASRNPWNLAHSTGGSSGGSAAAVAAGLVPVAHANDMGGSIRIPASFCGLVGLKPTRARSSLAPDLGEYWGPLTHEHVVTRSVRDCAAILDCIAGPAVGDPYSAPLPARPFAEELGVDPGEMKIGVVSTSPLAEVHPHCQEAVANVARLLDQLGHHVSNVTPPGFDRMSLGPWIQAGIARELDRWSEITGDPIGEADVEPATWMMAELGRALDGPRYVSMCEEAFSWAREVSSLWSDSLEILVTPTVPIPPPELGYLAPVVKPTELLARLARTTIFTMPFDVTGQPAISLPLYWDDSGLPIGVQLVAGVGREDLLFRLASQLESAQPWAHHCPAVHA